MEQPNSIPVSSVPARRSLFASLVLQLALASCLHPLAAAQCVFSDIPCPPTPPATPVGGSSGGARSAGAPVHDAYYYKIEAYNKLADQGVAAADAGNYQLALQYYLQAQQNHDTKWVRAVISHQRGNIAWVNGDLRTALADYLQARKICSSCYKNRGLNDAIAKLQQQIAAQDAARARQQNAPPQAQPQPQVSQTEAEMQAAGERAHAAVNIQIAELESRLAALPGLPAAASASEPAAAGPDPELTQQKAALGPLAPSIPTLGPMTAGIPGLPGIHLDDIQPSQSAQVAAVAVALSGPLQTLAEDTALQAAQKNPALTAPSDDPFVTDFQKQTQAYNDAVAQNQDALAKAVDAENRAAADEAALQAARQKLDSVTDAGEDVKQAYQQMLDQTTSADALAAQARAIFDGTSVTLETTRDAAAISLGGLAQPNPNAGENTVASASTAPAETTATGSPATTAANTASAPTLNPNAKPQILRPAQPPVTHPVQSVQACLARTAPAGQSPSLEDLDRKLEVTMKSIEQLAKSQENSSELGKEWREFVEKAEKDVIDKNVEALQDQFLGITKTTLEADREALKEPLEASMKQAQQLRADYLAQGASALQGRMADYKKSAQALLDRSGQLRERLEDVENFEGKLEKLRTGKEFGEWLLGTEEPCKKEASGSLNCDELKKQNGITKFLAGDTETQADLLKQVMDFGVHYAPTIKLLAHGNLIVDTWDVTSLVIDLSYDATVLYLANSTMKQTSQTDAKLAQARDELNARVERLHAEIGCYRQTAPQLASGTR